MLTVFTVVLVRYSVLPLWFFIRHNNPPGHRHEHARHVRREHYFGGFMDGNAEGF